MNPQWTSAIISGVSLCLGSFLWVLTLKIKHEILVNNQRTNETINAAKEHLETELQSIRDSYVHELGLMKEKLTEKHERIDRTLTEIKSNLNDRILATVNGKYVRSDLHLQTVAGIHERFQSFKEVIEVSMDKIEQGLNRQIYDLKERIFQKG